MKKGLTALLTFVFMLSLVSLASAGLINYDRKAKRAGQPVSPSPSTTAANPASSQTPVTKPPASPTANTASAWATTPQMVQNEAEKNADMNGDGQLQPYETKIYLRDVIDQVQSAGEVKADTDILKAYDQNKDGVIDTLEVEKIVTDVGK